MRAIHMLCEGLWNAWNARDAVAYAELFDVDAILIGFDGSQMRGSGEIQATLARILAHHHTAAYVGIVRDVRLLSDDVALLHAVVGMTPPGQATIKPAVNASNC